MSAIAEIVKAAKQLDADEFVKLRTALDQVEEKVWNEELERASAKHRKSKLTDETIDELVLKRRNRGRRP